MSTDKVPTMSRWYYGVEMLHELHDHFGSWTEVSRAVLGDGDNPGWAKTATKYRFNMKESHIQEMEKLLAPPKEKKAPTGERLTPDQRERYKEILGLLFDKHGWTNEQIGDALGISGSAVSRSRLHGGGMVKRLTRAQHVLDQVEAQPRPTEPKEQDVSWAEDVVTPRLSRVEQALKYAKGLQVQLMKLQEGEIRVIADAYRTLELATINIIKGLEIDDQED